MDLLSILLTSAATVVITLAAAAGGGVFGACVAIRTLREITARSLLSDALVIQAQKEAWILEGDGYQNQHLSTQRNREPPTATDGTGIWLREVEVRSVLDGAPWCTPEPPHHCYGFIEGRRAWIVRDGIYPERPAAYSDASPGGAHPALLSSQGFEELAGWIERVASARSGWSVFGLTYGRTLTNAGLDMLKPLLQAVATEDRIGVFQTGNRRLTKRAEDFLRSWQIEDKKTD